MAWLIAAYAVSTSSPSIPFTSSDLILSSLALFQKSQINHLTRTEGKAMRFESLLIPLFSGFLFFLSNGSVALIDAKKQLHGTWTAISLRTQDTRASKKDIGILDPQPTFTSATVSLRRILDINGRHSVRDVYLYKLRPISNPAEIDIGIADPRNANEFLPVFKGIYKFNGSKLVLCLSPEKRPAVFATNENPEVVLIVLKRKSHQ